MHELPHEFLHQMQTSFGNRFSTTPSQLIEYAQDESFYPSCAPKGVVIVKTESEIESIVSLCYEFNVPMIPFGAGSSLEGHVLPIKGGITIDMRLMTKISDFNVKDMSIRIEAGVTREMLNDHLKGSGLFFSVDPGANATIGGMVATGASGTNTVLYGTIRENVRDLRVVTADGRAKSLGGGREVIKSSGGYDLKSLFIGSEGTLGIVTEILVKLHPVPETISTAVVTFPTVRNAVETVQLIKESGIKIARAELLDALAIQTVNQANKMSLREDPTLFLEFHGSTQSVEEQIALVKMLAEEKSMTSYETAEKQEERNRLWTARHKALYSATQGRGKSMTTDVCVPVSCLADVIDEARQILDRHQLFAPILGHVGDGNFHCFIIVNPDDPEQIARAEHANSDIIKLAHANKGTCTGEHGIGFHKIDFLRDEVGEGVLDLMRIVKTGYDPKNLFNPGKIFHPRLDEPKP
jgi:D-lactate dehydrogenase (cytochrome)